MMRSILTIALGLVCQIASAQIELSYEIRKSLVGATNPEILPGGRILIDADSKTAVSDIAVIKVASTEAVRLLVQKNGEDFTGLLAYKSSLDPDSKINSSSYLLIGEGLYSVYALSRVNDTWDRKIPVVIGPQPKPPVPPEPLPTPDVPTDEFGNIGQRIAKAATGLPKRNEVSAVYSKYSVLLVTDPSMQITAAMESAGKERVAVLGSDASKYNDITAMLNADIQSRWPMAKMTLSNYMACIARGYKVGQ